MDQTKTPTGALWALLASLIFSVNDMLIKFLSDGYALHQVVFTRSLTGVLVLLIVVILWRAALDSCAPTGLDCTCCGPYLLWLPTCFSIWPWRFAFGDCGVNFLYRTVLITIFSVVFLGETVGKWRWIAVAVGLAGVMLIVRPGTEAFTYTAIFPALAALCYASFHVLTRKIGATENLMTLTFYVPVVFLVVTSVVGFSLGHGGFSGDGHRSLSFWSALGIGPLGKIWALWCLSAWVSP